jgi:class 3 adenylate cyclase/tetratricopeptide (TPR) repeat protein
MDIAGWLQGLGLERYEQAFRENRIEADVLPSLTVEDLKDLGVTLVGDRRRLLDAIAALGNKPIQELQAEPSEGIGRSLAPTGGTAGTAAERRQLTVMFCDLVGSTPLAARYDPEDLRAIIGAYHRCIADTAAGFGGFVARYMGDGALIYFGYPQAHEDDAERAIRCGLAVADRVPQLQFAEELRTRVGIATGLVVVGGEVVEHDIVGETPNLAARLQGLAEPDTVVIAASTRRLAADLFEYRDLGAVELKGIAAPTPAWQVLRPRLVESRFEALRGPALTPLIGRDEETDLLLRRWARAQTGDGQVVLICGEPGVGKSRITAELEGRLYAEPHIRLRYSCSPYHQDSALFPFVDQLERASGFVPDDPPAARLDKLEGLLTRAAPPDEDVAFIADLLSLPALGRHPLPNLSPQRKKERTLEALIRQLEGLAREQPVLMVFEDAHWVDPTSRELLDLSVDRIRGLPVLLIVTFRPEFQPPWAGQSQVTMLALNRLDRNNRTALIEQIAGTAALPNEVIDQIADRTDGVPLFIEELTKSVVEGRLGAPEGAPVPSVPCTLQASLMARLDRLPCAKQIAQLAAVIGREFSYELLTSVTMIPIPTLLKGLDQLVSSGLMFRRGLPSETVYRFKHALVQDTAYESLLRSTRIVIHARIVAALQRLMPSVEDTQPELLGHHSAQAGLIEKAADYYRRAGEKSITRSAIAEARAYLQQGLELTRRTPECAERHALEARIQLALGSVLVIAEGYGAADLATRMETAVALSRRAGHRQLLIRSLFGDWAYKVHIGDLATALVLAREMVALADLESDPIVRIVATISLGINYAFGGRFADARDLFEKSLSEPGIDAPVDLGSPHPQDHEVLARTFLSLTLACLGEGTQAGREAQRAIERARALRHQPSVALALTMGCRHALWMSDEHLVQQRATELIALSEEHRFPYWTARGRCYAGWVAIVQGQVEAGLALLKEAISHLEDTDVVMGNIAGVLGDAYARAGQFTTALQYVDAAMRVSLNSGEVWADAELHRLKGVILGAAPISDLESAEKYFLRAIDIAESQSAKLWELRAAISLARFWSHQGKCAQALGLLASIRRWFTEDRSVPDITEADALTSELVDAMGRAAGKLNRADLH